MKPLTPRDIVDAVVEVIGKEDYWLREEMKPEQKEPLLERASRKVAKLLKQHDEVRT